MALTILFTAIRSDNFQTLTVADSGTLWGQSGNIGTGDVTAIELEIFGTDNETPLKTVIFTSGERASFLAGDDVILPFLDSRLFGTLIAPDNFYKCQLNVSGGSVIATQVCFDSYFYIKKLVCNHIADVVVPIEGIYEANKAITGDLASLTTLEYLSSVISIARESKWRKLYSQLVWNYNL